MLGVAGTGPAARQQQGLAKVIPISRANNVSIMLTQFSNFRKGPHDIRRALVTGTALSLERLSLLLQVRCLLCCLDMPCNLRGSLISCQC